MSIDFLKQELAEHGVELMVYEEGGEKYVKFVGICLPHPSPIKASIVEAWSEEKCTNFRCELVPENNFVLGGCNE